MKSKLLKIIIITILLSCTAACAINKKTEEKTETNNTLTCTYDAILFSMAYTGDDASSLKVGTTTFEFIFNQDTNKIKKISLFEKFNNDKSDEYTCQNGICKEKNSKKVCSDWGCTEGTTLCQDGECIAYKKDDKLIIEYDVKTLDTTEYNNKGLSELKKEMESYTMDGINVVCKLSYTEYKEENNEITQEKDNTKELICTGNDGRTDNIHTFYLKNNKLYKHVLKMQIPDGYDVKEFYNSEEIMNSGRYKMQLDGRIIIQELDSSMAYWQNYSYKDHSYENLKDVYTGYGYTCK